MTQTTEDQDWLQEIPAHSKNLVRVLQKLAKSALDNSSPYHSVRVSPEHLTHAGDDAGRVLGWAISLTTNAGWEYENTTIDPKGIIWLLFKNPYVFS